MNNRSSLGIPVNNQGTANSLYGAVKRPPSNSVNVGPASGNVNPLSAIQQQQATMAAQAAANQQVQQRLLLQQRLRQQQQQQQNFEQQIFQLLTTLNRKPKRLYQFTEDTDAILKKYEQFKPSFEFHIYENNYKICAPANTRLQQHQRTPQGTSEGLILNKNNETLKEFLEYVARGMIPDAIVEVLRDCNIQFYEGCLILQVYDHTNTVDVKQPQAGQGTSQQQQQSQQGPRQQRNIQQKQHLSNQGAQVSTSVPGSPPVDQAKQQTNTESESPQSQVKGDNSAKEATTGTAKDRLTTLKRPRMYRTLLKPNDLTRYYDMLSWADHTRFSDSVYQQLEAEILAITKRNLRLETNLNPFEHVDKMNSDEFLKPKWDEKTQACIYPHRELSTAASSKGVIGHIEQHEELPEHSSAYEQMMLIMSGRTTTTTTATLAASLAKRAELLGITGNSAKGSSSTGSGGSVSGSNSVAAAAVAAAAVVGSNVNNENNQFSRLKFVEQFRLNKEKKKQQAMNAAVSPAGYNQRISMSVPLTVQQIKQQKNPSGSQQAAQSMARNNSGNAATLPNGKRTATAEGEEKAKPKRQRKTTKKAMGEGGSAAKKRTTKKQASNTTAAAPGGSAAK